MISRSGVRDFRNENNKGVVYLSWHIFNEEKGCDSFDDVASYDRLELFVKYDNKTIWSKCFEVLHTKKNGFNFFRGRDVTELRVVILDDAWKDQMLKVGWEICLFLLEQVLKCSRNNLLIALELVIHEPFSSQMASMLFFFLLIMVDRWKNRMFLSLRLSQSSVDF